MAVPRDTIAVLVSREDTANAQFRRERVFKDHTDVLANSDYQAEWAGGYPLLLQ